MEEDFILAGNSSVEEEEPIAEETKEVVAEEEEKTEKSEESENTKEEEPAKDSHIQALDAERARRKQAERELKELKSKLDAEKQAKEDEERTKSEREAYKKKLLAKDNIDEEVADTILDALGEDLIKTKLANERRQKEEDFDKVIADLKTEDMFMDADVYKPQIKELMSKGLSAEEAYFASVGKSKFSQMKKDLEVEIEQKILNTKEKAENIDVGVAESKGEVHKGSYTKREQEIARETGLTVEEVHKRSKMDSLEDFLNL